MKRNRFKKIVGVLHLWLGLSSGVVVFIVSITGALYAFEAEINQLFNLGVFKKITPRQAPLLGPEALYERVATHFDGKEVLSFNATVYPQGERASVLWLRDQERKYTAFLQDPYSGAVLHQFPYEINFWAIVLGLHTSLLIPEVGHHVVAAATLIFVVMLVSGLILWMPASRKGYKQRFRIKWRASPKRLNYDLHNVLGFYALWVSIFMAITGLVWSYSWVAGGLYWIATGGQLPTDAPVVASTPLAERAPDGVDGTFAQLAGQYPDAIEYFVRYPADSAGVYLVSIKTQRGAAYNRHDSYLIDPFSGEVLSADLWADKNAGEMLHEANYNLHVGAILGLPGKVLAFFAALVSASLPITGFYIWRGRRRRARVRGRTPRPQFTRKAPQALP